MDNDYGHEYRAAALTMDETTLRRRVDRLIEQCAREMAHPCGTERSGMLYASEILWLLGLASHPGAGALAKLADLIGKEEGDS